MNIICSLCSKSIDNIPNDDIIINDIKYHRSCALICILKNYNLFDRNKNGKIIIDIERVKHNESFISPT